MSAPEADAAISGAAAKLKPVHYILIIVASAVALGTIPVVSALLKKQKHADVVDAVVAGSVGTPYHPIDDVRPDPQVLLVSGRPMGAPPASPPAPTGSPSLIVTQQELPQTVVSATQGPTDQRLFGQQGQGAPPVSSAGTAGGQVPQATKVAAEGSLGSLLSPTETTGYAASRIAKPWATIEQGRVIACNSVTKMNSQLPGFVKAIIPNDVKSVDGTTTLIDRNSTVFGEISHGLAAGQDRLFVLWRSIRTPAPDFVRITINSPAADELGQGGLDGDVDHHTWKKISGALLLSGIDTGLKGLSYGLQSALSHGNSNNGSGGNGNVNLYEFQGQGQSLASDLLSHTVTIPDTLTRDQAMPCSIFLSGDLDFSSVYALRRRH